MSVHIRAAAGEQDLGFMLGLSGRLAAAIETSNHDQAQIADFQEAYSGANLRNPPADALTLLAETEDGERLGFIHALPGPDIVTGGSIGYVALLCVVEKAEGQGIGRLLLSAAESWARQSGYRLLSLDVFASNRHAVEFYNKNGFAVETMRMVKRV